MKYLRRLVWYLATRASVAFLVLALLVLAFYYAMNAANIYVVLKDGMAEQARVTLTGDDQGRLPRYFAPSALLGGGGAIEQPNYEGYSITGFDHRLSMSWMWCWPWDNTARAIIQEDIPAIDGRATAKTREAASLLHDDKLLTVPAWRGVQYRVVLERVNGRWLIKTLTPPSR